MACPGSDIESVFTCREFLILTGGVLLKTVHSWYQKIILLPPVVFYTNTLGGNGQILVWFYVVFILDLFCGAALAVKNRKFKGRRLEQWVVKFMVYTLCIYLIGLVDQSFTITLKFIHIPLLDLLVTLLLATEINSMFRKLQALTGYVPPVIINVSEKMESKAGRILNKRLEHDEEEKT
jgi:hypothetical protein